MSTKKGFQPTQNFIAHAVGENYDKALKVSTYHFDKLTADAAGGDATATALLALFASKHNALKGFTTIKGVDKGGRASKVATVQELLQHVVDVDLPAWQVAIQVVYPKKSADYKTFFPDGNNPFNSGKIDDRIEAILILHDACAADSHLPISSGLAGTINTVYAAILAARAAASGKKGDVKGDSGSQKLAIKAMCLTHFANVGTLIAKYPDDTDKINSYIDFVSLMDHHHGSQYDVTLHPDELKKALAHNFTANSTIIFNNTGAADVQVWISEKAKDKVHPAGAMIPAGTTGMVIHTHAITADDSHRILMVKNPDAATPASLEIFVGNTKSGVTTDPHD
jgi:hypothetical protein